MVSLLFGSGGASLTSGRIRVAAFADPLLGTFITAAYLETDRMGAITSTNNKGGKDLYN